MKPKRLTKREFLQRVLNGQLTSDRALARLTERLHEYEKKYKMRSEVFYKLIVGTPAEDQPDFLAWAICYRGYFRAVQAQLSAEGVLLHAP
jgi:Rad3-related DNA helicase